jgi:hypothetical protein
LALSAQPDIRRSKDRDAHIAKQRNPLGPKAEGISIESREEELLLLLALTTGVGGDLGDLLGL